VEQWRDGGVWWRWTVEVGRLGRDGASRRRVVEELLRLGG
jgi:hypothetical protein